MLSVSVHLLVLLVFVNRYVLGSLLQRIRGARFDEALSETALEAWGPSVTIVIPMYNEGRGIYRTIESLLQQDYPPDRLHIVVVDDCSKDDSFAWARRAAELSPDRVQVLKNPHNMGKRRGINRAVRTMKTELVVSVDSDVVAEPDAVRQLVRRFVDPRIAAVGGRVQVLNRQDNWLTRMQTIKYFFGYQYLKNLERACRSVMCLSGCLTAYRREVLLELEPILEERAVLGVPIKYGEDRFLTRQIVKAGYQTVLTLDAVSYTVAPRTLGAYFSQQLRWRRSNLVDYLGGLSHATSLDPLVAIHYFSIFALLLAYPAVILQSLVSGHFWDSVMLHFGVLTGFGVLYRLHTRNLPASEKVGPFAFLAMGLVMPVTYLLLTPLALFTLDSGSWETRGHQAPAPSAPDERGAKSSSEASVQADELAVTSS